MWRKRAEALQGQACGPGPGDADGLPQGRASRCVTPRTRGAHPAAHGPAAWRAYQVHPCARADG
eukprot:6989951-Alexandrium_andersonii.AAC.1